MAERKKYGFGQKSAEEADYDKEQRKDDKPDDPEAENYFKSSVPVAVILGPLGEKLQFKDHFLKTKGSAVADFIKDNYMNKPEGSSVIFEESSKAEMEESQKAKEAPKSDEPKPATEQHPQEQGQTA